MSVPLVPPTTCQVAYFENGALVTDGLPAVATGYFHPLTALNVVPVTGMCAAHYQALSPRELAKGFWTFNNLAPIPVGLPKPIADPNIQAPPQLNLEEKGANWLLTTWHKLTSALGY